MTEQDLTQRIIAQFQELRSMCERVGVICTSLERDYQALLKRNEPSQSPSVSSQEEVVQSHPKQKANSFELITTSSWFSALEELRRQGSSKTAELNGRTYICQFTLKENLQARIEDYNALRNLDGSERTIEERQRFFNTWLDSCSGIHYLARTTRFKIITQSPQLITLAQDPTADYLSIPYAQSIGRELDSSARGTKYNCDLSRAEVLEHSAWLTAVEEDRVLLGESFDVLRQVKNARR